MNLLARLYMNQNDARIRVDVAIYDAGFHRSKVMTLGTRTKIQSDNCSLLIEAPGHAGGATMCASEAFFQVQYLAVYVIRPNKMGSPISRLLWLPFGCF